MCVPQTKVWPNILYASNCFDLSHYIYANCGLNSSKIILGYVYCAFLTWVRKLKATI